MIVMGKKYLREGSHQLFQLSKTENFGEIYGLRNIQINRASFRSKLWGEKSSLTNTKITENLSGGVEDIEQMCGLELD